MIHRLFNSPIKKAEFDAKKSRIRKPAGQIGYDRKFIDKLLRKHECKTKTPNKCHNSRTRKVGFTEDLSTFVYTKEVTDFVN